MIGIYKIINPKNKIYIGQSTNINIRFNSYKKLQRCNQQKKLYNSLKKYGPENHIFEILEECSLEQLNEREIYWIKFFDSFKKGLNLTEGGEGVKGYKRSKIQNSKHSEKMTGRIKTIEQKNKIANSLKGKNKPLGFGEKLSNSIVKSKTNKIYMQEEKSYKNPNHYLAGKKRPEWVKEKIKQGMEKNKKPTKPETIEKMRKNKPNIKAVLQYDLNNNFIKEWPSFSEAARYFNIDSTGIMNCCKGKQKTAAGFKWILKTLTK
jgi:group I intron endonuclease